MHRDMRIGDNEPLQSVSLAAVYAIESKGMRRKLADSPGDEACLKRLPLPANCQESATTTASTGTDVDAHLPKKSWSSDATVKTTPLETHDEINRYDLPEEIKQQALVMTQQKTGGASETFPSPRDDVDQSSWLRLDCEELSQLSSNHPDYYHDFGSSLESLDLEFQKECGHESYGTYISGMRSLAKRQVDQSDVEGFSELTVGLDSNKVVPHERTASKVYDRDGRKSSVRRKTIHPIDNRPAPERARGMSMLQLLRKQTTRGAGGEGRPGCISCRCGTGASAGVRVSDSAGNCPREDDDLVLERNSSDYGGARAMTSEYTSIRRRANVVNPIQSQSSSQARKGPSDSRLQSRQPLADCQSDHRHTAVGQPTATRGGSASRSSLERRAMTCTTQKGVAKPNNEAGVTTRRSSVRHLGSILGGLLRKKPSGGQSSESRHSPSAGELAGLGRSPSETSHTGGKPTTSADKTSTGVPKEIRRGWQRAASVAGCPWEPESDRQRDAHLGSSGSEFSVGSDGED